MAQTGSTHVRLLSSVRVDTGPPCAYRRNVRCVCSGFYPCTPRLFPMEPRCRPRPRTSGASGSTQMNVQSNGSDYTCNRCGKYRTNSTFPTLRLLTKTGGAFDRGRCGPIVSKPHISRPEGADETPSRKHLRRVLVLAVLRLCLQSQPSHPSGVVCSFS